ncbi:MAG TPA: translation initiation factor IF-2 [Terriglobia bacterium]|nr:translation initiation factor IF-2 [Terriglobia bacterium]
MSKIRINELARELEVKSNLVLDYLVSIGEGDKKSHSSALDDDLADRVRRHFSQNGDEPHQAVAEAPVASPIAPPAPAPAPRAPSVAPPVAPAPAAHVPAPARPAAPPVAPAKPETPLVRTIDQIKQDARRTLAGSQRAAEKPAPAAAGPVTPLAPGVRRPGPGISPVPGAVLPSKPASSPVTTGAAPIARAPQAATPGPGLRTIPGAVKAPAPAGGTPLAARGAAPAGAKPAPSSQPIYPGIGKGAARPAPARRPGEHHRQTHPTATRPAGMGAPAAGGALPRPSRGGFQGGRPSPGGRPTPQPMRGPAVTEPLAITRKITLSEGVTIKELSEKLETRARDVIKKLLDKGIFATINQTLDSQTAAEIARTFGAEANVISYEEEVTHEVEVADRPEDLRPRAPVVTVMGHVDHGKTSLLDAIRQTNVTAHEAGGITQHIGAYRVEVNGRQVVFLDTPGHEAFTLMRARGAKVTDIVVLVVAADDGVMPQTLEAINHARAAKVPIVVAINKIDKADAQPDRVMKQLADLDLMAEEWGGSTVTVKVSAKQRENLDVLLEMILLVADLQGLKASPNKPASGTVLESRLDRGRGPVATLLVQSGTLKVGDPFIVGAIYGKVRAMLDDHGHPVADAGPSTPVEILGLEDVPQVGDRLYVIEDTIKARQISLHRLDKQREAALAKSARLTLEQLHEQLAAGEVKELPLIIKGDVQGSVEALVETLNKLSNERVKIKVIHAGVGAITEGDVLLASASNAVIVGFSVRPERKATDLAQFENVDIRLHTIIYDVTDEIKKAMQGLLAVTIKETVVGHAEVRDVFRISKVGTVAGCYVQDGKFTRDARIRLLRDNAVVHEGRVRSLRRFKEDVPEVRSGMECGISLENFSDLKVGDVIESFVTEKVTETMPS